MRPDMERSKGLLMAASCNTTAIFENLIVNSVAWVERSEPHGAKSKRYLRQRFVEAKLAGIASLHSFYFDSWPRKLLADLIYKT